MDKQEKLYHFFFFPFHIWGNCQASLATGTGLPFSSCSSCSSAELHKQAGARCSAVAGYHSAYQLKLKLKVV